MIPNRLNFSYECGPSVTFGLIRRKIAKSLNDMISPQNIEIFNNGPNDIKYWTTKLNITYSNNYQFDIVPYQTDKPFGSEDALFNIQIYGPSHSPNPFWKNINTENIITVKYRKRFKVNQFIQYLFETISKPFWSHQFSQILQIINNDNNNDDNNDNNKHNTNNNKDEEMELCPFCNKYFELDIYDKHLSVCIEFEHQYKIENNMKMEENDEKSFCYILCKKNRNRFRTFDCFGINDIYHGSLKIEEMKLFIKRNNKNIKSKIKLIIRFAKKGSLSSSTNINNINNLFIGFPLILYINKQDSLKEIMNKYINKYHIVYDKTYHIQFGKKVISIPCNIRNDYLPYSKFLRLCPNDFIVITCIVPSDELYTFSGKCLN